MRNFILLDPGVSGIGGPRFEYLRQCLQAADSAGYQPLFIAPQRLPAPPQGWPRHWEWLSCFGDAADVEEPLDYLPRGATQLVQAITNLGDAVSWQGPQRQAAAFLRGCRNWLSRVEPQAGDQVFVPFATPFHFLGLGKIVRQWPLAHQPTWHLQFHLDLAQGQGENFAASPGAAVWRPLFAKARHLTAGRDVRLYTPSPSLTAQYVTLQAGPVSTLPLPLSEPRSTDVRRPHAPLRLLCVGRWDNDYSRQQLSRLLLDLWHDELSSGALRIAVWNSAHPQGAPEYEGGGSAHRAGRALLAELPSASPNGHAAQEGSPLVPLQAPARTADYRQLLRSLDAGLLLCPPAPFRHRSHALLWDLAGEGLPLILPAECWLAEQLGAACPGAATNSACLLASSPQRVPALIRDLRERYSEYRQGALQRARDLRRVHSAAALIRALTASLPALRAA